MNKFDINDLVLHYGDFKAIKGINLGIEQNKITSFIGPSGCGKSTVLKTLNRMNDLVEGCKIDGQVLLDGQDIFKDIDVNTLRKRVGMVFQHPNPFPMSIYDNLTYGPITHGIRKKSELNEIVERTLRQAALWDEVKDKLKKSALALSGGQQQRLCIARALTVNPEVILMDEPTSALDPQMVGEVLDVMKKLAQEGLTMIIVTHEMAFARDVSNHVVYMADGIIEEEGDPIQIFTNPQNPKTKEFLSRFMRG